MDNKRKGKSRIYKYVLRDIKQLIDYKDEPIENRIDEIKSHIRVVKDLKTKITLSSITIILKELKKISDMKKSI